MNYQSATGMRCFMFILGAVFARDADEAEKIANAHIMRGDEAYMANAELCRDYIEASKRLMRRDATDH